MSDYKITLLIPFFGKFPEWSPLFFETLKKNPTITFIFYTDCETGPYENISNLYFRKMSFAQYIEKSNSILPITFNPANAYKLCDLRPFYPLIHYSDIKESDFYGWVDMDVLLGDIRSFYTDDILSRYDVLSTHKVRISGHLALFRNINKYRGAGKKIYAWKTKLAEPHFVGLDEHGITNALTMTIFDKINEKFSWNIDNQITRYFKKRKKRKIYLKEQYTTPFTSIPWIDGTTFDKQPDKWFYTDGCITNNRDIGRSFIYLHFMNFKSSNYRHDGSKAPWEGKEKICFANADDMVNGIQISLSGIEPLQSLHL